MSFSIILVTPSKDIPHQGTLSFEDLSFPCALGRSGVSVEKLEGDGITPVGTFSLRAGFYRADRLPHLDQQIAFPLRSLSREDGWCDDREDGHYNQFIRMPFLPSHEDLWRDDHVYDLIIPIGYNDDPIVRGRGSAIFLHVAREGYPATAGCVAISQEDFLTLLKQPNFCLDTKIQILDGSGVTLS